MNLYKAFGLKKARPSRLASPGLNAPAMGVTPENIRRREERVKRNEARLEPGGDWSESLGRAEQTAADVKSGKFKSVNPQAWTDAPKREREMYQEAIRTDKVGPDVREGGKTRPRDPSKASERGFWQQDPSASGTKQGTITENWKSGPEFARQVIAGDPAARPGGKWKTGDKTPQITPSTQAAKAGTTLPKANVKQYQLQDYAAAGKPSPKPLVGQGPLRPGQTRAPTTSSATTTNIKAPKIKAPKIKAPANVGALGSAGMGGTSSGSMGGGSMGGGMGGGMGKI